MSENDAQTSTAMIAAAVTTVQSNDALAFAAQISSSPDDWSNWAMAGADVQPLAVGVDLVSGDVDTGDWFPSVNAAAVLALAPDIDPLVKLPSSDLTMIGTAGSDGGMDIPVAQFAFASQMTQAAAALDTLAIPADHGMPLDHIEWHFTGLLPLV